MKAPIALIFALVLMAGCSTSNHYTSLTKEETAQMVADNIAARDFVIDVDRALPMRGRNVNLTSLYSLKIEGDSVDSHLPYYGRAYSIPYGGGEGMIFSAPITDYKVTPGKKGETIVQFIANTREDRHQFTVTLWPNGSSDIYVMPQNRQSITYTGKMHLE